MEIRAISSTDQEGTILVEPYRVAFFGILEIQ